MEHKQRAHALLSASGASRWLNCPPSARLEDAIKEEKETTFAAEGTLAHELGELELRKSMKLITAAAYKKEFNKIKKNEFFTEEMPEEVEKYTTYVLEEYAAAKKKVSGTVLLIEEKIDLTDFIPDGFGTGDAGIISDGTLEIIDLKYGKGIEVSAENNKQLKLYALGMLRKFELAYDIRILKLTICQPRLNNFSSWEISAEDLETWGRVEVKPKAKMAHEGKGLQKCGDWCRWCKVLATCSTAASYNMKLAKHEFKSPHLLDDTLIMHVYDQIPMLLVWAEAVKKHVLAEALDGKSWPGLKLVEGRSVRKWANEEEAIKILNGNLYESEKFITTKIAGIGVVEKLTGKSDFDRLLSHCVVKPQGAPTLAPEDDKRPALGIEQAKKDFK